MVWYGMVWYGMVWYGTIPYLSINTFKSKIKEYVANSEKKK